MALDLTPEQKSTGKANFEQAAGDLARGDQMNTMATGGPPDPTKRDRRDFLKAGLAAGAVVPVSAAVYFGYHEWKGNKAVRTALIGCGDEGGVLVGDHNPEFNEIVAVCDIRPTNLERIYKGEPQGPRKGLNGIYGKDSAKKIKQFETVDALLGEAKKLGIEAVIIATPLITHDAIAIECMKAGLHVLCEKLMARTIGKCKDMTQFASKTGKYKDRDGNPVLLSVGHQRHYSTLYAQALEVLNTGILGDIKHIRALWHRNNSWPFSASAADRAGFATGNDIDGKPFDLPALRDGWCKPVPAKDAEPFLKNPTLMPKDYKSVTELVRWRLYNETGGGLMAELGSHQLDAASIILGHVHPISVQGVGGKFFYGPGKNDRQSDDGVFVTYEFPGKTYYKRDTSGHLVLQGGKPVKQNEDDIVVVTYTSFNTNSFEKYGECVMGSRGTMVIEEEKDVYLFKEAEPGKAASGGRDTRVTVTGAGGGKPAMEATSTWGGGGGAQLSKSSTAPAWDSAVRGYRTEMEHFAFCLRKWQEMKQHVSYEKDEQGKLKHANIIPRCHGEVAMADAILALTANMAMNRKNPQRIKFDEAWFEVDSPEVPETKHAKA